jgi:hypothetical protein
MRHLAVALALVGAVGCAKKAAPMPHETVVTVTVDTSVAGRVTIRRTFTPPLRLEPGETVVLK